MVKKTALISFSLLVTTLVLISVSSCKKKDQIDTTPGIQLRFSTDTVFFDTVFTTIGSVTRRLMVYNDHSNKVRISSIILAGGGSSNFRINVDGDSSLSVTDVEIPANDSLFVFVRVTVDPNNQNGPMVVADSLLFSVNGNQQNVKLVAWGWDAHFYRDLDLQGNVTFDSLKPHVVFGHLRVDTAASLTILAGSKIYFHKDAYLAVSDQASLKVLGNLGQLVTFQGDRLDPFYRDLPGQWGGIYLEKGSRENEIRFAMIKNGITGVQVDSAGSSPIPMLQIDNTIIRNVTGYGLFAYASNIKSVNCVVGDCGSAAIALVFGGSYDFRQLTIGNYWSSSVRRDSSLYITNYTYDNSGGKRTNPLTNAYFGNIILYGTEDEELGFDADPSAAFNYKFDHCLLKTKKKTTDLTRYIQCIVNEDPLFRNPVLFDYRLDSLSPAREKGISLTGAEFDILGVFRGATPDLGAYQYQQR
jgi:hypothetical protein